MIDPTAQLRRLERFQARPQGQATRPIMMGRKTGRMTQMGHSYRESRPISGHGVHR
jgi:hypothetical protein